MSRRSALPTLGGAAVGGAVLGTAIANLAGGLGPRVFGVSTTGTSPASADHARRIGTELGRTVDVVSLFDAWEWRNPFPTAAVTAIREMGSTPEITWEPWHPARGAEQGDYRLDALTDHETYVREWARAAAGSGGDLLLRFGHEMNSDWYPWAVTVNGGSPDAFVEGWRWLHGVFAEEGATNVRWVWCPNIVHRDRVDLLAACYPGSDVVDVTAVDGYSASEYGTAHLSPEEVFGPTFAAVDEIDDSKPLWINETGCAPGPGKTDWITGLVDYLSTTRVSGLVWFEIDNAGKPDWRLTSTPATTVTARHALRIW
ncbi:glycoside hydrolase family 26 protein [Rhodococcus triatomae]|nr:beta-mannanase [Rhodococcus triatomae BKS 15-14]